MGGCNNSDSSSLWCTFAVLERATDTTASGKQDSSKVTQGDTAMDLAKMLASTFFLSGDDEILHSPLRDLCRGTEALTEAKAVQGRH